MNYSFFRPGSSTLQYRTRNRFLAGCILVSIGILLAAGGGSWDITNHLLNRPETFFAAPHAVLYSGAATAVLGTSLLLLASRATGKIVLPAKMALAGVIMLVSAGPVDFAWHSTFGLDGLFSPPHFVLVSGMVLSSLGALAGMVYYKTMALAQGASQSMFHTALVVLGILPLWLALSGVVDMLTLPFSRTQYFNFDPDPVFAVAFATLAFPFLIAASLCGSSALAGRRFGALSFTGAAFIATSILTSLVPNSALHSVIPFYALNIIPVVAADALLSHGGWSGSRIPVYIAGAIVGLTFYMLYFPLITHTYNEFVQYGRIVWPAVTISIYFELMATVYSLVVVPAAATGLLGAVVADRLVSVKNRILL